MVVRQMRGHFATAAATVLFAVSGGTSLAAGDADTKVRSGPPASNAMLERGRYIVRIAGCNDCHTPGYAQTGGRIAERDWLIGDQLGWQGPWGTTYPINLRIALSRMSEDEWMHMARSVESRPPMPWFALRDMADNDLRAVYRFVRSLGVAGGPAPAYVPPGREPAGVAVLFPMPPI